MTHSVQFPDSLGQGSISGAIVGRMVGFLEGRFVGCAVGRSVASNIVTIALSPSMLTWVWKADFSTALSRISSYSPRFSSSPLTVRTTRTHLLPTLASKPYLAQSISVASALILVTAGSNCAPPKSTTATSGALFRVHFPTRPPVLILFPCFLLQQR